jgi:hypothetical protein
MMSCSWVEKVPWVAVGVERRLGERRAAVERGIHPVPVWKKWI